MNGCSIAQKLAAFNGLTTRQVAGFSHRHFLKGPKRYKMPTASSDLADVYPSKRSHFILGVPVCRLCTDARDVNLTKMDFYFDTHLLVKKLEMAGFNLKQCEAITDALVQVLNTQIDQQSRNLVTKSQQEITVQQLLANISSVKKDMLILEKSEFSALRNETEKQTMEINRIKQLVNDEIAKLKGQVTLDINLEKSRAKEAHAEGEKDRSMLNNRIDMEVANLRTTFEQYRNDVLKYAGGTVLSCLTISLGFYRLWS